MGARGDDAAHVEVDPAEGDLVGAVLEGEAEGSGDDGAGVGGEGSEGGTEGCLEDGECFLDVFPFFFCGGSGGGELEVVVGGGGDVEILAGSGGKAFG